MGGSSYMSYFYEFVNFYLSETCIVHKIVHIHMSLPTWGLTE